MTLTVYGFPTTGKTFTAGELTKAGLTVIDCDTMADQALKDVGLEGEKPWRKMDSPEYLMYQERYEELLDEALSSEPDVFFTNSWEYFRTRGHPDLAFIRTDAQEVVDIATARGDSTPMPLDVVEKWLKDTSKIADAVGELIVLGKGEFMTSRVLEELGLQPLEADQENNDAADQPAGA